MIVFYHIPKTAGSSIVKSAEEVFPGRCRRIILADMQAWRARLERDGDAGLGKAVFLSGHFGYGIHHRLTTAARTFTFVREPMEQALSMYQEAIKRPELYPQGPLDVLLRTPAGAPYFSNPQVRHLAADDGIPITGPVTHEHLRRAQQVLANELSVFGVSAHFSSSLTLLRHELGLDLTPREVNASARPPLRALDEELLHLLWTANALDRELYLQAVDLFMERIARAVAARGARVRALAS